MLSKFKNVYVLAPHTDDGELGAGGFISKLIEKGANIYYSTFSTSNLSYCNIGCYGDFAVVSQLLGHKEYLNDGIMYLLMSELVCELIAEKKVDYLMYDTFWSKRWS